MAIAHSRDAFSVADRACQLLRDSYADERAIIVAESPADLTPPPDFLTRSGGEGDPAVGGRVMIGDGRVPMQHDTQVLVSVALASSTRVHSIGIGRATYTLTALCRTRSQVYQSTDASHPQVQWETTDRGQRVAASLGRTVEATLLRNLLGAGIYSVDRLASGPETGGRAQPDVYGWRVVLRVHLKVFDPVMVSL